MIVLNVLFVSRHRSLKLVKCLIDRSPMYNVRSGCKSHLSDSSKAPLAIIHHTRLIYLQSSWVGRNRVRPGLAYLWFLLYGLLSCRFIRLRDCGFGQMVLKSNMDRDA
uniref:Secreted protein n=1 Tax=Panagrellus redivivus TaxID=6233 RepID=A0A7E4W5P3_PANRE